MGDQYVLRLDDRDWRIWGETITVNKMTIVQISRICSVIEENRSRIRIFVENYTWMTKKSTDEVQMKWKQTKYITAIVRVLPSFVQFCPVLPSFAQFVQISNAAIEELFNREV